MASTHQIRAAKLISIIYGFGWHALPREERAPLSPVARELRASHGCQRVAASIFCDFGKSGPGEVRAADHHLIGNHPIEQPAAGGLGHVAILVESSVPGRMIDTQRWYVSGIVRNHQLCIAGGEMEGGMARRVSG